MVLLAPWLQSRSYAKNAILWHEGDRADRLVVLDAGRLRAFRQLADGRTATVLQFGAGEVLGFSPFFDEGGYPATVQTLEPARIRYVVRQDLVLAMREPRIAMALLGLLARRLRKAFDGIEQLSLHRALPRVAAALQALVRARSGHPVPRLGPARRVGHPAPPGPGALPGVACRGVGWPRPGGTKRPSLIPINEG
jgi:CRP-like cAMP-binding protein